MKFVVPTPYQFLADFNRVSVLEVSSIMKWRVPISSFNVDISRLMIQ